MKSIHWMRENTGKNVEFRLNSEVLAIGKLERSEQTGGFYIQYGHERLRADMYWITGLVQPQETAPGEELL